MSHTTRISSVPIRSVSAIRSAVELLKQKGVDCELLMNAQPRAYYANQIPATQYVLRLNKSRYDVGLDLQADGSYLPVMDTWAGEIEKQLGNPKAKGEAKPIAKFLQAYTRCAAIESAVESGYFVESVSENDATGEVVINVNTGD